VYADRDARIYMNMYVISLAVTCIRYVRARVAAVRNLREYFAPRLYVYVLDSMLAIRLMQEFYLLLMRERNGVTIL